jgi:hypothetical protein
MLDWESNRHKRATESENLESFPGEKKKCNTAYRLADTCDADHVILSADLSTADEV